MDSSRNFPLNEKNKIKKKKDTKAPTPKEGPWSPRSPPILPNEDPSVEFSRGESKTHISSTGRNVLYVFSRFFFCFIGN